MEKRDFDKYSNNELEVRLQELMYYRTFAQSTTKIGRERALIEYDVICALLKYRNDI